VFFAFLTLKMGNVCGSSSKGSKSKKRKTGQSRNDRRKNSIADDVSPKKVESCHSVASPNAKTAATANSTMKTSNTVSSHELSLTRTARLSQLLMTTQVEDQLLDLRVLKIGPFFVEELKNTKYVDRYNSWRLIISNEAKAISPGDSINIEDLDEFGLSEYRKRHSRSFRHKMVDGIPSKYRWSAWKACCHISELKDPGLYERLKQQEGGDEEAFTIIDRDVPRTFPEHALFDLESPFGKIGQGLLRNILRAFANYDKDIGYCQGMNFLVGFLLLVSGGDEENCFWMLVSLMNNFGLRGFFQNSFPLLKLFSYMFDFFMHNHFPKLQQHLVDLIPPEIYTHKWFMTLFLYNFPLPMCARLWDAILSSGLGFAVKIGLALMKQLRAQLLEKEIANITTFLNQLREEDTAAVYCSSPDNLLKKARNFKIRNKTWRFLADKFVMSDANNVYVFKSEQDLHSNIRFSVTKNPLVVEEEFLDLDRDFKRVKTMVEESLPDSEEEKAKFDILQEITYAKMPEEDQQNKIRLFVKSSNVFADVRGSVEFVNGLPVADLVLDNINEETSFVASYDDRSQDLTVQKEIREVQNQETKSIRADFEAELEKLNEDYRKKRELEKGATDVRSSSGHSSQDVEEIHVDISAVPNIVIDSVSRSPSRKASPSRSRKPSDNLSLSPSSRSGHHSHSLRDSPSVRKRTDQNTFADLNQDTTLDKRLSNFVVALEVSNSKVSNKQDSDERDQDANNNDDDDEVDEEIMEEDNAIVDDEEEDDDGLGYDREDEHSLASLVSSSRDHHSSSSVVWYRSSVTGTGRTKRKDTDINKFIPIIQNFPV